MSMVIYTIPMHGRRCIYATSMMYTEAGGHIRKNAYHMLIFCNDARTRVLIAICTHNIYSQWP